MQPVLNEPASKVRYRFQAAEALLYKRQEGLASEVARRSDVFSAESMLRVSKDLLAGFSSGNLDELRALCRQEQPQPVMALIGRCITTLISTGELCTPCSKCRGRKTPR